MKYTIFNIKTLKGRIISYQFIIICLIAIFVSICTYWTTNGKTVQNIKNSLRYQVSTISEQYQKAYEEMINIVLICSERKSFDLPEENYHYTSGTYHKGIQYVTMLNDYCAVTGYQEYISKISVFNKEGALIQTGTSYGNYDDGVNLTKEKWFPEEIKKSMSQYKLILVDSPFYKEKGKILPIISRLNNSGNKSEGWVALCISDKLFHQVLKDNDTGEESIIVTGSGERIATAYESDSNRAENDAMIKMLLTQKEPKGILEMKVHGKPSYVAYERDIRSGVMVYRVVAESSFQGEVNLVLQTIFIMAAACVTFGLFLSVIFTNQLQRPIDRLVKHIQSIAEGNFTQDVAIEGNDEIGRIGTVINSMSGQIERMMEQRVKDVNEKNRLELKMLQAQINPHFLYNTLNSIKWIAVIQNNSGIVKAVTALSGLLKNMAKGVNEKITLRQELIFLEDYITIEKLKYVELFDVVTDIKNPKLYEAKIIKLTLQPLVENAIFSGIEPSGKNGTIWISATTEEDCLCIRVKDNGKGIPKGKLETILSEKDEGQESHVNGIGLSNVNKRIKLMHGEMYGLEIKSEEGFYTEILIRIPLEY